MAKHTPGPWNLVAGRTFETSSGTFSLFYGLKRNGEPRFSDPAELDYNARLIAAAPELLEALRDLLFFCRNYDPKEGDVTPWENAEAAVLKATGEE